MIYFSIITPFAANINNLYLDYVGLLSFLGIVGALILIGAHYLLIGPHAKELGKMKPEVLRLTLLERTVHFIRMVSFIILIVTGISLAVFNVGAIGLTYQNAFSIHLIFAVFFLISTLISIVIWLKDNSFNSYDREWFKVLGGYFTKKDLSPPSGRFNAGQKVFYWFSNIVSIVIIITGYFLIFPANFTVQTLVWATVIHGITALILTVCVLGHAYLGSVANPGTLGTITHGKVSKKWVKVHHPNLYDD